MVIKVGSQLGCLKVVTRLGSGSFATVYKAVTGDYDVPVALKAAKCRSKGAKSLQHESYLLELVQGIAGVPTKYGFFCCADVDFIVTSLHGASLETIFRVNEHSFDTSTITSVGTQLLRVLQHIHYAGVVHRDVKPANVVVDLGEKSDRVILVDFGLAKDILDNETGRHQAQGFGRTFVGTQAFASLNAHLSVSLSRRDDLESLFYMLLYLRRGELPWQQVSKKAIDAMVAWKSLEGLEKLCKASGIPWYPFVDHCRKLGFGERPNYSLLRKLLDDDSSCGSSGLPSSSTCCTDGDCRDGSSCESSGGFPSSDICGYVFPNPCKISL